MSLRHMIKQYRQKKFEYSKILSVSDNKRKLMLYLYTATYSKKTKINNLTDNFDGMV